MKQTTKQTGRRGVGIAPAVFALGAGAFVFLASPGASAQQKGDFGQQGQFIISGDRLFQLFSFDNVSSNDITFGGLGAGVQSLTTTTNSSAISLFYGSNGSGAFTGTNAAFVNGNLVLGNPSVGDGFFTVPRVGLDYVILPNVTIGGDLVALFTLGGSTTHETDLTNGNNSTTTVQNPSVVGFGVAPRGGYIIPMTEMFSLWLRGGFSYYTATAKQSQTNGNQTTTESFNVDQFGVDLEPMVVFHPIPHIGFTAGVTADIPLAGGHSENTTTNGNSATASAHSSIFYLGIELGMLAHF